VTSRARIALIATGGTIDALGVDRLDLAFYTETRRRLDDGEMLRSIGELASVADVTEIGYERRPSYELTPTDWLRLSRTIQQILDDGYDGVVVTHGTNTLEETAFFLDLTVNSRRPVVVTGAMRPANALGSDGALNLFNAVRVAASAQAGDIGCLVLLNDTIHSARQVTKSSTFRVDAFRSPDAGPLGYADADGCVQLYQRPAPRPRFDVCALESLPRVDVILSYLGADGTLIDASVAAGARGIVSAGTGAGRATREEDEALDRAIAQGIIVCQASRVGAGRVARSPAMARRGVVAAGNLQPWKARILLALSLGETRDPDSVQELFDSC